VSKPEQPPGGYDYPNDISINDTNDYSYPIRDILSTGDSFNYAYYERYWHRGYNEPNLSIRPQKEDVYRLTFKDAFGDGVIITLLQNKIIAKQWIKGDPFPEYDSTRLDSVERYLYQILYWNFPVQERIQAGRKRLDSISKKHPQILDPVYYRQLLDKCLVASRDSLLYTTHELSISTNKYYRLINHINSTGYWKMPYEIECKESVMDGYSLILEANTKAKYNIVLRIGCTKEENPFIEVCNELINAAHLKRPLEILAEK
jgi:hypothetical protein